ncbi:DNA-deoxyinosine glycosylase [Phenylobacterium sp.]|uniref:DNA-deoxyinosine glycosylase n=1 Tax=Phenylobacterium sp. TaxID=1871053 RepID=UPI00289DB866|nr:DNA-deoxyinosine glycosylase [Phenylobacterium sp.]
MPQSAADRRKASFAPVADARTRLLVLGSLPGERSLAAAQYYANPQNQFWRLMQEVTGRPLAALPYAERLEALLAAGVGLWDVVGSAVRPGSLDTAIRDHRPNALPQLCARLPALRAVAFNGGKAAALGARILAERTDLALIALPSSSPAHTIGFERKLAAWTAMREVLKDARA